MTRSTQWTPILVLCLFAAVFAASCKKKGGGEGQPSADAAAATNPTGGEGAPAAADAAAPTKPTGGEPVPAEDVATGCDPALLAGTWLGNKYSVRFAADLSYEAAGAPNLMQIDVTGKAAVEGCRLSFTDATGKYACPPEQVGVYDFTVDSTTLRFTVVGDVCDGRRMAVGAAVLAKQ